MEDGIESRAPGAVFQPHRRRDGAADERARGGGPPLVLIFHGRGDESAVREMNRAIRERFPSPEGSIGASFIDLSFVPPICRVAANMELDRA